MSDASKIDDGGSAFPVPDQRDPVTGAGIMQGSSGLSRRDYFAAAALPAVIAMATQGIMVAKGSAATTEKLIAEQTLAFADALIAASSTGGA